MKVNSILIKDVEALHERLRGALKRLDDLQVEFTGPYATSKGYVIEIDRRLLTIQELLSLFERRRSETAISRDAVLERVHRMPQ